MTKRWTIPLCLVLLAFASRAQATLLVHYKFDGDLSEVPFTGAQDNVLTARDSSNTTITPNGSAYVAGVPGLGGQALVLGSTGGSNVQWASTPDASDPDLGGLPSSTDWTIEMFFQPKALPGDYEFARLALHWDAGSAYHFSIHDVSSGSGSHVDIYTNYSGSGTQAVNGTTDLSVDTWYYGAVVKSGSTVTLYLNGAPQGSYTVSGDMADDNNLLFFGSTPGNTAFAGYIDDVRIWNEAVSAGYLADRAALLVPEPGSLVLMLVGMGTVLCRFRRKRSAR